MESKVIILLVFASAVQGEHGSYIPKLNVSYGLSKKQVAVVDQIIVNKEKAAYAYIKGLKTIFRTVSDPDVEFDDDRSEIYAAFANLTDVADICFDSVQIALKASPSDVRTARNAVHRYLRGCSAEVIAGIKLAKSGNNSKNLDAIEMSRAKAETYYTNLMKEFYDVIPVCLDNTEPDVQAVINRAHKISVADGIHMVNAVFNAIKFRAASSHSTCGDIIFASYMADFEDKALYSAARNETEQIFGLLKTLYMYPYLNQAGIVSALGLIQYAVTAAYESCKRGNDVSFGIVVELMDRVALGLSDDGDLLVTRIDVASAKALAWYNSADFVNFEAIMAIYPKSTSEILAVQGRVIAANVAGGAAYFDAVRAAVDPSGNYSETLERIAALRKAVVDLAPDYTAEYFAVIHNNRTFSKKIEASLSKLLDKIIYGAVYATETFLDAVSRLAYVVHTGKVSRDDFAAVKNLWNESNFAVAEYSQGISAMSLKALVANNAR